MAKEASEATATESDVSERPMHGDLAISQFCIGEKCRICGEEASHKVEEVIFEDEPAQDLTFDDGQTFQIKGRHPLTAYLCHEHFAMVMGPAAERRNRSDA